MCQSVGATHCAPQDALHVEPSHLFPTASQVCQFSSSSTSSGRVSFCNDLWYSEGGDFKWGRRSGNTPSSSTGPSSGPNGGSYAYIEASSPNYSFKKAYMYSDVCATTGLDRGTAFWCWVGGALWCWVGEAKKGLPAEGGGGVARAPLTEGGDLQEKIDTASRGEECTGDCPGPRKETTDGLHFTQGGGGGLVTGQFKEAGLQTLMMTHRLRDVAARKNLFQNKNAP